AVLDQALHEPGNSAASMPSSASTSAVCAAVTPDPQHAATGSGCGPAAGRAAGRAGTVWSVARRRVPPGSQASLREANRVRLVEALKRHGRLTQVELAGSTGLSPAT